MAACGVSSPASTRSRRSGRSRRRRARAYAQSVVSYDLKRSTLDQNRKTKQKQRDNAKKSTRGPRPDRNEADRRARVARTGTERLKQILKEEKLPLSASRPTASAALKVVPDPAYGSHAALKEVCVIANSIAQGRGGCSEIRTCGFSSSQPVMNGDVIHPHPLRNLPLAQAVKLPAPATACGAIG